MTAGDVGGLRQAAHTSDQTRRYWDEQAATFDDEADHGLRDPSVRQAWADLLLPLLPPTARVADLGCGTGSLSVLLGQAGHDVHGVDLPPRMIDAARAKATAAGVAAHFSVGDAAAPPAQAGSVDVVLVRHVLWTFEEPGDVLASWISLLAPGGRLLPVEGRWSAGAGLAAVDCEALVRQYRREAQVRMLCEPWYWGKKITDERYLLVSSH